MTISLAMLWMFQVLCVPLCSPFAIGLTRNMKAKLQNRAGASVLQPYRDLAKLLRKNEIISTDASWIFRIAPFIVFGSTLVAGAGIPLISSATRSPLGDFLFIVYVFALGTFFLALAGMDTGSAFGGFGSSREMMVSSFAEGGLVLSLLTPVLLNGGSNLFQVAGAAPPVHEGALIPLALAAAAFAIALLAETARYPFDNPATHLELTMIHEAIILEYSGKRLALMEWAAANKYLLFIVLGANIFFPWEIVSSLQIPALFAAAAALAVKIALICGAIAVLESTTAKLRIFRLPDLLFTSCILGIIAIGLIV